MQSNFLHMAAAIAAFVFANLLFMGALFYYRKSKGKILPSFSPALKNRLLKENAVKLCFIFAAAYFTVFIYYSHTGIGCENLDTAAQCECYALEVMDHKDLKQKKHWAHNGLRMCPGSTFFSRFLNTHP